MNLLAMLENKKTVAPYVGAWIEITTPSTKTAVRLVAPYVGAWIEIFWPIFIKQQRVVAPYVGAWIEIFNFEKLRPQVMSNVINLTSSQAS